MPVNYKKELEQAARNMILVHRPDTLIRLILRTIVRKVRVEHAGLLLYERQRDSYIVTVTRGRKGAKLPAGFIRLDATSPLIRVFSDPDAILINCGGSLIVSRISRLLKKREFFVGREELEKLLLAVKFQIRSFEAVIAVPAYYQEKLLGVLLLGQKRDRKAFKKDEVDFFLALANDVAMALQNAFLFEDLQLEIERNKRLFFETTLALSAAIDAKDHYTRGHTSRVTQFSLVIARRMMEEGVVGIDHKFLEQLKIASLLHDIGKIGVPEAILNKPGALTDDERKKINEHSLIGAMILEPIKDLDDVILGVKYHHERWDGKGYPEGLKAEGIPLNAAIIAVADSYDAMTTDRPYRKALTRSQAAVELERCAGSQFHPQAVRAALVMHRKGEL